MLVPGTPITSCADELLQARDVLLDAFQAAESMIDSQAKALVLIEIGALQARAEDLASSAASFEQAAQAAKSISEERDRYWTFVCIAEARAKAGDLEGSLSQVEVIPNSHFKSSALSMIAVAQAEAGEIEKANQVIDSIEPSFHFARDAALIAVAEAEANAGRVTKAIRTANEIGSVTEKRIALINIARLTSANGNIEGARQATQDIDDSEMKSVALEHVAIGEAKAGNTKNAIETAETIRTPQNRSRAIFEIAVIQARRGDSEAAEASFNRGLKIGGKDGIKSSQYLKRIALGLLETGKLDRATAIAGELERASDKAQVFKKIAGAYATENNLRAARKAFRTAIQFADEIRENYQKAAALRGIASAQGKVGFEEDASLTFKRAIDAAGAIPIGGGTDVIAFIEIGIAQAQLNDQLNARQTFQRALSSARSYPEEDYVAQLLESIAQGQAKSGDVEGVLKWVNELDSSVMKARSFCGAASGIIMADKGG